MGWLVATTKSNAERYATDALKAPHRGCTVYYPKVLKIVAHAGRVQEVERPFLPRYIFVQGDMRCVVTTPGVTGVVHCGDRPSLVKDDVIDAIRDREVDGYVDLDEALQYSESRRFRKDEVVRVTGGPFAGFYALFQEKDGLRRALLFIQIFGTQTKASAELNQIERL